MECVLYDSMVPENQEPGYLPKEADNSILNKSVLRHVWSGKMLVGALGLRNENEAREWFRNHPEVHLHFEAMNEELAEKIEELKERGKAGLQEIVVKERRAWYNILNRNLTVVKDEP